MPRLPVEEYQVGWVCVLPKEMTAARAMLDEEHEGILGQIIHDPNSYVLGRIHGHNVVMACLPTGRYGITSAATVANNMLRTFPNIRLGLMVGIGAGVPNLERGWDIRLGDVVVSRPERTHGGVIQYDFKKNLGGGTFELKGFLSPPPTVLLAAMANLQSRHIIYGNELSSILADMHRRLPRLAKSGYIYPGEGKDQLHCSTPDCISKGGSCSWCQRGIVKRPPRDETGPEVHYGTVVSGNELMQNAVERDRLGRDMSAKCIEMEAAGLMNDFPCLVIRGICDYADSYKDDVWQEYAAATAAAFAKELLKLVQPTNVNKPVTQPANINKPVEVTTPKSVENVLNFTYGLNLFDAPDLGKGLFIGRLSEIQEMEKILHPKSVHTDSSREILILGGMGGVGKTQLSIAYAKNYRSFYSSIFWLSASTEAAVTTSLRGIANRIMSPEKVSQLEDGQLWAHVSNWLSETKNTRWLLIFDNYDDPTQYNIKAYYPPAAHGSIIITTRQPRLREGRQLKIEPIGSTRDNLQILATRSQRDNVYSDPNALKLIERLDGYPLALATAGAFLKESSISFGEYLEQYEARWRVIDSIEELPEYPARTLFTTWNLSFELIQQEDMKAAQLLKLLAYFDNRDLWYDLLHGDGQYEDNPGWFEDVMEDKFTFESRMYVLTKYCLVETSHTTGSYSLHICVHDWILNELNKSFDGALYRLALDCLSYHIPYKDWDNLVSEPYNRFTPHAKQLAHNRFVTHLNAETIPSRDFWKITVVAELLYRKGQFAASCSMQELLLSMKEEALGPEAASTLETMNNLGVLYLDTGRLVDAERLCMKALTGKEKVTGPEHPSTLMTVNNLGLIYSDQRKLAESKQMYLRALDGYEKVYDPDHPSILDTLSNLGFLYYDLDQYADAEKMYIRALVGSEKVLGPEHPSTLMTVHNMGLLYAGQNKFAEAEHMYKRALDGNDKALGPEHPSTLTTVYNLARLFRDQGKAAEAEPMFQRVVTSREKMLGPNHPDTRVAVRTLDTLRSKLSKDRAGVAGRRNDNASPAAELE